MLRLDTNLPELRNDLGEIIRLFFPGTAVSLDEGETVLRHRHERQGDEFVEWASFDGGEPIVHRAPAANGGLLEKRMRKRAAKTALYILLRQRANAAPPWGSLTGIRPTRLMYEALEDGMSLPQAERYMIDQFDVQPIRAALLRDILDMQSGLIGHDKRAYDLYIGIPFCTTRCDYCSFSSGALGDGRLVAPYLDALLREMRGAAELINGMGLRAGYMGGGTPTSLSARQLDSVLDSAMRLFPSAIEWTVEAGRPDTIDRDKLAVLQDHGVGRISINPQSFSDETLVRIGRAHTAADTVRAFELARACGFAHINMDLIAALPGEDEADFARSLDQAIRMNPESVTVHTLAIKHGSKLHEAGYTSADEGAAKRMVDLARDRLARAGYRPYYLYRQKYMADNLENVGYAKPGCACRYNIDIMEETSSILALGAGAITKWLFPRTRRIERAPNVKNIEQYIARVDEMLLRKTKLIEPKHEEEVR